MAFTPPPHTVYQWYNAPSTNTPLDAGHLEAAENDLVNYIQQVADLLGLAPTSVQTNNYNANGGDFVPIDTTGTAVTITLPTNPPDQSLFGVVYLNGGVNAATVSAPAFAAPSGTSITLQAIGESYIFIYNEALETYYTLTGHNPLNAAYGVAQLGSDGTVGGTGGSPLNHAAIGTISSTLYAQVANNLSDLASAAAARSNLGLGTAATQNFNVASGVAKLDTSGTLGGSGGSALNTAAVEAITNPLYATLASPVFTGTPNAPTPPANDSSTRIATTAFITDALPGIVLNPSGDTSGATDDANFAA